jgi:spore coat polysaccharide biosynthesis protein SpsF
MSDYLTEQEKFWAGEFGDEYINRNRNERLFASKISIFNKILGKIQPVKNIIEFGANIGLNLHAIKLLIPDVDLAAIEINPKACGELRKIENITVYEDSIITFLPPEKYDFVFTSGVLIHINPDELYKVYENLYNTSNRYICLIEYYNPTPVAVTYRGHENRLFKRDFAGDMLDLYKNLNLIDYGFVYRRDSMFPADDATWFLMEKR